MGDEHLAESVERCLISPNESDTNGEPANVVDKLAHIGRSCNAIAKAITPQNAAAGHDAVGGRVESLTEAVMGMTAGLVRIADAMESIASALDRRAD